jgi:hypothetical protein
VQNITWSTALTADAADAVAALNGKLHSATRHRSICGRAGVCALEAVIHKSVFVSTYVWPSSFLSAAQLLQGLQPVDCGEAS